ncbi:uncharacterized protein LOC134910906 [Pseudophryne corroboree]|uniref:uncharacterized protein LOC134910906 n=1 Tax=Pseudophryne corroboree TaxID=495146 RepID=UPI003081DA0F
MEPPGPEEEGGGCSSSITLSPPASSIHVEGRELFTHCPSELRVKVGETATFTCNITALEHNPKDFNWYREQNNKQEKIADLKAGQNDKLTINVSWDLRIATLRIQKVTLNDSGNYYCVHVNVTESSNFITSRRSELIVESHPSTVTEAKDPTNQKGSPDNVASLKTTMISTSILLTLLLLLLIGLAIFLVWHKQKAMYIKDLQSAFRFAVQTALLQGKIELTDPARKGLFTQCKCKCSGQFSETKNVLYGRDTGSRTDGRGNKPSQPQVRNLENPPQDPTVYTVDYGVLEFGSSEPYRNSADLCVLDQVEYATIIFPQEKPTMEDHRDRTA